MTIGREPFVIVEIDQDFCNLTYGIAPCTAAIGVTGTQKCFNTAQTCQDRANYDRGALTLRFGQPIERHGYDAVIFPTLRGVSTKPSEINIAGTDRNISPLGKRSRVTITLSDHPHHDRGIDPYIDERTYDAMTRGTFWSKWLARNPFFAGREIRVREGYLGDALASYQTRRYIIENITGPNNGTVTIHAADPLKLTEATRAQAPRASTGVIETDITDTATSLTLTPAGIGDTEYATSGIVRIGGELIEFTRSSDVMTLVSRGLRGTDVESHDNGDIVQEVLVFDGVSVEQAIYDLLDGYTSIAPDMITLADWQAEAALWLQGFRVSAWITEPTSVGKLLAELQQQCLCYIWWDERDQQIQFRAIRPLMPTDTSRPLDWQSHIIADSFQLEARPDERISQVWIYYDQINPTEGLEDGSNYRRLRVRADLDAETADEYGEQRIRKIFSRWFTSANDAATLATSVRILNRFRDAPTVITMDLDAKDRDLVVADIVVVTHPDMVDETGEASPRSQQIVSLDEFDAGHALRIKTRPYEFTARYAFMMANGSPDFFDISEEARDGIVGYICPDSGVFSDGSPGYRII